MMSKLKLTDREWSEFFLEEVTQIHNGVRLTKADMVAGSHPFIGASEASNGVTGFVENSNASLDKEVLGVNYNGSVGHAFYHPYRALFSDDVKRIRWKNRDANNKYTLLYLATVIAQQRGKYAYGYKFNAQRMKRQIIMLPITSEGNPDWAFMEAYMRQMENELLETAQRKLDRHLLEPLSPLGTLENRQWREFLFSEVFTQIQRGKRLKKGDHIKGEVPYVSSTANSNGLDGFVGNTERVRIFSDCITLANSGSVGSAFYQQYIFVASDHITMLKRDGADKYIYLFMLPIVGRLSEKYSFNREINDTRIAREKLLLPVTSDSTPDWEFMSAFMKHVEQEILRETLMRFKSRNVIKG